ncbi:MAG: threonine synthase [Bacteroidota bacterium]
MKYKSTTGNRSLISFREAVLANLPSDGGLFFPEKIPPLEQEFLDAIPSLELAHIAEQVLALFCGDDINKVKIAEITSRVFNFPIPIKEVTSGICCLELFHGPTFAFKDIGAMFLAECLAHFNMSDNKETTVLVATSGDTGGAVANGFLGVEGVKVVILYPKGKVSKLQEKQLTTLGQNITALEIEGNFDDCQNLVKQAFGDRELNHKLQLSSANSINIARWLPQSLFYYIPIQQGMKDIMISVPSGNYGNLTSGILAMKMGVSIVQFIAASNANDVVPRYLVSGDYQPEPTKPTIANAMDVSDPSNFKRLLALFGNSHEEITKKLTPFSLADERIKDTVKQCYTKNNYLLDPHSAIAYEGLKQSRREGIFLGTAHYCKFLPTMNEALNIQLATPDFAADLLKKETHSIKMEANYREFKELLVG